VEEGKQIQSRGNSRKKRALGNLRGPYAAETHQMKKLEGSVEPWPGGLGILLEKKKLPNRPKTACLSSNMGPG